MDIEQPGNVVILIANLLFFFYDPNLEFPRTTIQIQHELLDITSVAVEFISICTFSQGLSQQIV